MALDQEELDEYVPLSVCLDFARDFLKGLRQLMKEIGLDNHDEIDWLPSFMWSQGICVSIYPLSSNYERDQYYF